VTLLGSPIETKQAANKLILWGYLCERNNSGALAFASPLHAKCYFIDRYASRRPDLAHSLGFEEFIVEAIRLMNPEQLKKSISLGKDNKLLERQWQMEFYRVSTSLLSANHFISPDVGTYYDCAGYLDFYIDDDLNWAIELLREGRNIENHKKRFQPGGQYYSMMDNIKKWIIIDFRAADKLIKNFHSNLVHVGYTADYKQAVITWGNEKQQQISLIGAIDK